MADDIIREIIAMRVGPDAVDVDLSYMELDELPLDAIPRPENIQVLSAAGNRLRALDPGIAKFVNLEELHLGDNPLRTLPIELGSMWLLQHISLDNPNEFVFPPPEIVAAGTAAIKTFLRDAAQGSVATWRSKFIVVGEGGTGKTSLVNRLRDNTFEPNEPTTHGINITHLEVPHPALAGRSMDLRVWDFGGQQIYHATHQFFLSARALFVLTWNARLGWEQGRLVYWLEMITARAPEAPVIIVATHCDEREPVLPDETIAVKYPQIVSFEQVSNLSGRGIPELEEQIRVTAASLPLMGSFWPASWVDADQQISRSAERFMPTSDLWANLSRNAGLTPDSIKRFLETLHELGDILYFGDDPELAEITILRPQWVVDHISLVLDDDQVEAQDGLLSRQRMHTLWADIDYDLRGHFLRLMERFDLSYRTLDEREVSLVVERLPYNPPEYAELWENARTNSGNREIGIRYQLGALPAGVPTWFIARAHRFTTHKHWRYGALFARPSGVDLALVVADPYSNSIELAVRGPFPQEFLTLLRDGLELTLQRFPGLSVDRFVRCPCRDASALRPLPETERCPAEYRYDHLARRLAADPPRVMIECPESFTAVDVRAMLFGIRAGADEDLSAKLTLLTEYVERNASHQEATLGALVAEMQSMRIVMQREFLIAARREQSLAEALCPSLVVIVPTERRFLTGAVAGQLFNVQLYCEAPGSWHAVPGEDGYNVHVSAAWWRRLSPILRPLIQVLKHAVPLAGPLLGVAAEEVGKQLNDDLELMSSVVEQLPVLEHGAEEVVDVGSATPRELLAFLRTVDPSEGFGGLRLIVSPEGHTYWLCSRHAAEYRL